MTTKEKLEQLGWEIDNKSGGYFINFKRKDMGFQQYIAYDEDWKLLDFSYISTYEVPINELQLILDYIKEQEL